MIRLSIAYNGKHLKSYEFDDGEVTVGRLPENTISIANVGISRRHFRIEPDNDRNFVLSDLNSLNGVAVNGAKVRTAILQNGDIITIGKYAISFELVVAAKTVEPQVTGTDINATAESPDSRLETIVVDHGDGREETDGVVVESASKAAAIESVTPVLIEISKHVVYRLDKKYMTLGNAESDDIFVSGFMVGDEHVVLEHQDGEYWIKAMKLMGKFKVNNKKTRMHRLEHKDRIEIGNSTFRFMENQ